MPDLIDLLISDWLIDIESTTTQLLESSRDWNIALSSRLPIDVIYLDYAKAFDSVVHTKLLAKLSCYGIKWSTTNLDS